MMLAEICHEINNWFVHTSYTDTFTISDGSIELSDMVEGQYFRIIGSIFNDGVYQYPASNLTDETFDGAIWGLAIPKDFLDLVAEIETWQAKYGAIDSVAMSPYTSESFGGYSYSKNVGSSDGASSSGTWQSTFASRLNKYRRIRGI